MDNFKLDRKAFIENTLLSTNRHGMEGLLKHMDLNGFYSAPCSGQYHLSVEGGLAEHSINVYNIATELDTVLNSQDLLFDTDSIVIVSLLHDLGKMGHHGKPNYVPTEPLKSGKAPAKPYETNKNLLYVPHEVESVAIVSRFIELTEDEEFAILQHNGLYGDLKNSLMGKEQPLQMLLHFADLWASRVTEK